MQQEKVGNCLGPRSTKQAFPSFFKIFAPALRTDSQAYGGHRAPGSWAVRDSDQSDSANPPSSLQSWRNPLQPWVEYCIQTMC